MNLESFDMPRHADFRKTRDNVVKYTVLIESIRS